MSTVTVPYSGCSLYLWDKNAATLFATPLMDPLSTQIEHPGEFISVHAILTLKLLLATTDAQWEGMGDGGCRVGEVRAGTTSPMPDHEAFKLQ